MYPSFPFLPSRGCCIANLTKYRQLKVTKLIVEVVQASLATVGSPMVITAFGCTVDSVYRTQLRTHRSPPHPTRGCTKLWFNKQFYVKKCVFLLNIYI